MVDSIRLRFPQYEEAMCRRDINDAIRGLTARRPWSGLVKYAVLNLPAAYITGTIAQTNGSNVITGAATSWPVTDLVNTTLGSAIIEAGYVDFTPVSMTGIRTGMYLLVDGGGAAEEAVFVIATTSTTFRAACLNTHAAAAPVTCSSLAGQQIRVDSTNPFFTVIGVSSATRMLTDKTWSIASTTAQGYTICKVYVSLGTDVKQVLSMVNLSQTYRFALDIPKTVLDQIDARRSASQFPYCLSFHEPDPAGSPMWEIYPRPTVALQLPYIYLKAWSPLAEANEILPNGIRSDILVKMGMAAAARWPGHKVKDGGIYYDPKLAGALMAEAERDIEYMKLEDDSTAIMSLLWQYSSWRVGSGGGMNWAQSHDVGDWG